MHYIYILESRKDKKFYTGYTVDLIRRLKEHNQGFEFSTRSRTPFRLAYYEACLAKEDALAREKYLKSGVGKRYIKNRIKYYLQLKNF